MQPSTTPHPRRTRRLLAGLATTTLATGLLVSANASAGAIPINPPEPPEPTFPTTTAPPANTPPTARLTWNRVKRVGGVSPDADLPTIVAYVRSPLRVNLDACASRPGSAPIAGYRWTVHGAVLHGCRQVWTAPGEGTFSASVTVTDTAGRSATTSQQVVVRDHYVVALGDSIASGEGNPAVPAERFGAITTKDAGWPHRECHRTPKAATQQAMAAYEQSHPRESVTYVNLACSGAKILHVLQARLGGQSYEGIDPDGSPQAPQLDQVESIAAATARVPELVYVSAGANDFGFADITMTCLSLSSRNPSPGCGRLDPVVAEGEALLAGSPKAAVDGPGGWTGSRYAALARAFTAAGIPNSRVAISQYPDPTRDDDGTFCPSILADNPLGVLGVGIRASDVAWAGDPVNGPVARLNGAVAHAASRTGWRLVPGIATDFRTHGYCADTSWVLTYDASNRNQGDDKGTLHPNAAGTAHYARRIRKGAVASGLLPA